MTPSLAITGVRAIADALIAVIIAPACAACGELLTQPTRGPVCPRCWAAILPLTPPLCDSCGDPLPTWRLPDGPGAQCPRCRRLPTSITRGRAIGAYDGALRAIVHALKYDGRRSLARPLAALMRVRGHDLLVGADTVVPVPLHPARHRQRGFNQAADLARHLGPPVCLALRRVRRTRAQTGLPAAQRHANVRNAFAVHSRRATRAGRTAVLIDDVSTTGATLEACARALKAAGVVEVRALTVARAVTSRR